MTPGDKVTVEGEVVMVGESHIMVRFPKVGHHRPETVRVPMANVKRRKAAA